MEDHEGHCAEENLDFEGTATNTGPKGVINDWRKFKLESEDEEAVPPSKRELLRQMSSPFKSQNKAEDKDKREKYNRKMSKMEYELMQDKEDESCLQKYRKQCMKEMHSKLSFGPTYGQLYELESGDQFLEVIEKEHKTTTIIVHIYEDGVKGCDALTSGLTCLALEYPVVKFCKIRASHTGAGDRFTNSVLPTLLVYKAGELIGNFLCVTEQFGEEFFAVDIENFLNEYGLLPEREFSSTVNGSDSGDDDDNDIE
ncbi:phosducin [Protopterus annectens]|uniref:phosducin n=1 Tax=Protopterus annectens TaxID=7888 RepID=UPI001CFA0D5B|nr:phosducin [Protopterus annectens]